MATLFNTKIKDTYQSLLKLEDNTILTTTSKNITDGLGNASPLYLSTTRVGIGTNAPTTSLTIYGGSDTLGITGPVNQAKSIQIARYNSSDPLNHYIGDDGNAFFGSGLTISASGSNSQLYLQVASSGRNVNIGTAGQTLLSKDMGARLGVRGSGSTSATTSLLVQNSSGTESLKVQDDNIVRTTYLGIGGGTSTNNINGTHIAQFGNAVSAGDQIIVVDSVSGSKRGFKFGNQGTIRMALIQDGVNLQIGNYVNPSAFVPYTTFDYLTGNVGIGTTTPAFKTQISSSGTSTSISTIASSNYNLVVQNTTDVAGTYSGIGFMNPYDTQGYIGVSQITTGYGAGGNMLFALRPSLGGAVITEYMRLLHNGNLLIGTTTDAGFKLNVNGSINITGGNKLNFNNGSSQCWITTAGGATGPSSRSISLPGTGGGGDFIFYNDGPYGIRITESGGDTLVMSPGNSSVTGIMGINKSAASGYGGGTFIYYQSVFGNRMYTFGNPSNERGDEGGSHTKIAGGAAGFLGNGGHVYLEAGAKGTQVGSVDGNIIIAATRGNVAIGTSSPTAKTHIVGSGSTSATTSLLVQNSSAAELLKVTDDGVVTGAAITSTGTLRAANNKLEVFNSGNQVILRNPALGNYFYIGPNNSCGVDNIFSAPNLYAGSLNIYSGSPYQGSNIVLSNFIGGNTGTNYGLTIQSGYSNNGAGGPNYGKQVRFYDNLNPNNIQLDMTFAYVNPIINYQGTANGAVVGYDFNPVVTAVTANTKIRAFQSSVGGAYINTTTYQASAVLQADSTTQGFLPPRVTTIQKNAIATPAEGLMVYDTDLKRPCFFNGTSWITL